MSDKHTSPLDRLIQQATGKGSELGWSLDPAKGRWPKLWRWLTSTDAGEDYVKDPATLTVKATMEGWQATLSDRTFGVSVDATSESLEGVFDALETMLGASNPVLRTWPNHKVVLKPRPKKKLPKD